MSACCPNCGSQDYEPIGNGKKQCCVCGEIYT